VVVAHNPYLSLIYRAATAIGLRDPDSGATFLTMTDLWNLARLSGFDVVRVHPLAVFPWKLLGIGSAINAVLSLLPLVRWLGIVNVIVLRPLVTAAERPSLSSVATSRRPSNGFRTSARRLS
jgi:hypothetical protein